MYLSVIIPAYNEAQRIEKTLKATHAYLSRQSYDYEIFVVSDGSIDDTVQIVKDLSKKIPHLKIIDNKENQGKGWVVCQGMLQAKGDYRLFMDADNSTSIDQVAKMLPWFEKGYDIVIGSRRIKGAKIAVPQPWIRELGGAIFRCITHTMVPLGFQDSQAGFKIFSKKAAELVFSYQTIFRWTFDIEILAIARLKKLKIKEAPIIWINDAESKLRLTGSTMLSVIKELFQVRRNLWAGKYRA